MSNSVSPSTPKNGEFESTITVEAKNLTSDKYFCKIIFQENTFQTRSIQNEESWYESFVIPFNSEKFEPITLELFKDNVKISFITKSIEEVKEIEDYEEMFPSTEIILNFSIKVNKKEVVTLSKPRYSLLKKQLLQTGSSESSPKIGPKEKKKFEKSDFEFGKELGKGAYSKVFYTTYKKTGDVYATKVVPQKLLIENNQVKTVKMEKQVLSMMDHPNIIGLFCTYVDDDNLYFALEFAPGGDMFGYLDKYGPIKLDAIKFYLAELICGLEYMHGIRIIHRDLKPENLIFDKNMHLKITDFGTAKVTLKEGGEISLEKVKVKGTFCGTAQFVSPELINGEEITYATDLWAVGCILYQMFTNSHAFSGFSDYLIFQKIKNRELEFPSNIPDEGMDLIDKLLQVNPTERLGTGEKGYEKLKSHSFFNGIDWKNLKITKPPEMYDEKFKQEMDEKKKKQAPSVLNSSPSFIDDDEEERIMMKQKEVKKQPGSKVKVLRNEKLTKEWGKYLLKDEYVVYCSPVLKRAPLSFGPKKRQLILTTFPRLIYIDTIGGEIKGSIPWSEDITIIPSTKTTKRFDIKTPGRIYDIEDATDTVDEWMEKLEALKSAIKEDTKNGLL